MARNEEKAQSMLNRWMAYKQDLAAGGRVYKRRPASAASVDSIAECERWRMQLMREIGRKVMSIQNESLGEQRIRDLNDEINKLIREKAHWERRIIELGGPNYRKYERIADEEFAGETSALQEEHGQAYKYFGAARNLKGVKELLQSRAEKPRTKRTRYADMKGIDGEYYGYKDDNDVLLEKLEAEAETKAIARAVKAHKKDQPTLPQFTETDISDVVVPSKEEMEALLVKKKKEEMLKKYLG